MTNTAPSKRVFMGVDIGGTKIAAGLVDAQGAILTQLRTPMISNSDAASAVARVRSAIDAVFAKYSVEQGSVAGIGICAPGPLDPKTGIIINPPNLPCWRNFPLASEIAQHYGVPVVVDPKYRNFFSYRGATIFKPNRRELESGERDGGA